MDNEKKFGISDAIDDGVASLKGLDPTSEEYAKAVGNLQRVADVKKALEKPKRGPSADAWLNAVVTILLTGSVLLFEASGHYIASKGFSVVQKFKRDH